MKDQINIHDINCIDIHDMVPKFEVAPPPPAGICAGSDDEGIGIGSVFAC